MSLEIDQRVAKSAVAKSAAQLARPIGLSTWPDMVSVLQLSCRQTTVAGAAGQQAAIISDDCCLGRSLPASPTAEQPVLSRKLLEERVLLSSYGALGI